MTLLLRGNIHAKSSNQLNSARGTSLNDPQFGVRAKVCIIHSRSLKTRRGPIWTYLGKPTTIGPCLCIKEHRRHHTCSGAFGQQASKTYADFSAAALAERSYAPWGPPKDGESEQVGRYIQPARRNGDRALDKLYACTYANSGRLRYNISSRPTDGTSQYAYPTAFLLETGKAVFESWFAMALLKPTVIVKSLATSADSWHNLEA